MCQQGRRNDRLEHPGIAGLLFKLAACIDPPVTLDDLRLSVLGWLPAQPLRRTPLHLWSCLKWPQNQDDFIQLQRFLITWCPSYWEGHDERIVDNNPIIRDIVENTNDNVYTVIDKWSPCFSAKRNVQHSIA